MSRKDDRWHKAPMEGSFGGLEAEMDGDGSFRTRREAQSALFGFMEG